MDCKDCLYYELCKNFKDNICQGCNDRHNEYVINKDGMCDRFKDRNRFVELPCKVGVKVYDVFPGEIIEYTVESFVINKSPYFYVKELSYQFKFEEIGKTVFLTREVAEEVLKEREQNDK